MEKITCNDFSSKPSAVKSIDSWYSCANGWTFDINVSLGRDFVNENV